MISLTENRYWINTPRILLQFFHQNICGLLNKKEELLNSLTRNSLQIICITEHHLIDDELEGINNTLSLYFGSQIL